MPQEYYSFMMNRFFETLFIQLMSNILGPGSGFPWLYTFVVTNYGLCAKIDVGTNGMTASGSAQMFNCVRRE